MMRNSLVLASLGAVFALGVAGYGCSSSSDNGGTGGKINTTTGTGGSTTTTGTGGSTTTTGTGGSTTTTGTGGSTTTTGTGGATGADGGGLAACQVPPPDKSGCQGTEATCTKACGPNVLDLNMGRPQKACACTGAAVTGFPMSWDCTGAGPCTWSAALAQVACFHLPSPVPACPTDPTGDGGAGLIRPNATTCTLPAGTTCGLTCGSATTPTAYQDSNGVGKMGYCVCVARAAGGARWQCASVAEWAPQ